MHFRTSVGILTIFLATSPACGGDDDGSGEHADAAPGDGGTADASGPTSVTLHTYDGALASSIALVAFQDGDGEWQRVDGAGGLYTFTVESGRYAIATVCDMTGSGLSNGIFVRTLRLLASEASNLSLSCPWHERTGTFTGSFSGLVAGDSAAVNLGTAIANGTFADPDYSAMILGGSATLVATRQDSTFELQRIIIERGVSVQDGGSHNFDLAAGGFAPVVNQYEITGVLADEEAYTGAGFYTNGEAAFMGGVSDTDWSGIPAAQLEPGDIHRLEVEAGTNVDDTYRQAFALMTEAADTELALPPPGEDPTVTLADTSPYVRLSYEPARSSGHLLYELKFYQVEGPPSVWSDLASSGWLDAGHPVETPDLSAVDGWDSGWELEAGSTVDMTSVTYAGTSTVAKLLDGLALTDSEPGYFGAPVDGLDGLAYTATWWQDEVLP